MAVFSRKDNVVEAHQFKGDNTTFELMKWFRHYVDNEVFQIQWDTLKKKLIISSDTSVFDVIEGQWIIFQKSDCMRILTNEEFEDAFQELQPYELENFSFGVMIEMLKEGAKVQRTGWNGNGLWLELQMPDENSEMTLPYIYMSYPDDAKNTPGARVPWLASQTDILAEDWKLVN